MIILLIKKIVVNLQEKNPCKFVENIFLNILWEDFFLKSFKEKIFSRKIPVGKKSSHKKFYVRRFFPYNCKEKKCCRNIKRGGLNLHGGGGILMKIKWWIRAWRVDLLV